jgi:hypothetical protein
VTAKAKGGGRGTISKPKGLQPGTIKPKPQAKPAPVSKGKKGSRTPSPDKVLRVTQRVNDVTRGAESKTGVRRMNATEVGVRAKSFLTRKAGGMSGMVGEDFQQQQSVVRAAMTRPTRYSTQTPNRNKPGAYNNLGQSSARSKAAEAAKPAAQKIKEANTRKTNKAKAPMGTLSRRSLDYMSTGRGTIRARRTPNTIAKPKKQPSSTVARTRPQSKAAQRNRRNQILDRTRPIVGRNPGIRRVDTGMRQLSLTGPSKTLYGYKRTKIKGRR